ncbi:hypothetical protein BGX27_003530, partial [Mortierella sp. AM989]
MALASDTQTKESTVELSRLQPSKKLSADPQQKLGTGPYVAVYHARTEIYLACKGTNTSEWPPGLDEQQ